MLEKGAGSMGRHPSHLRGKMTAQELFDALFFKYNQIYFHNCEHKCWGKDCKERPSADKAEGYAEAKKAIPYVKLVVNPNFSKDNPNRYIKVNKVIKKGRTIRFTHASNMGVLDGTLNLDQETGYDFRLQVLDDLLENCRLTRDISPSL
jgi:hypothetical protein